MAILLRLFGLRLSFAAIRMSPRIRRRGCTQACGCHRISIERRARIYVPLEAGSRNCAAPWEPKSSGREGASWGGWSPSPLADEEDGLGDNDIVPGHLSCARMYNALRTSATRGAACVRLPEASKSRPLNGWLLRATPLLASGAGLKAATRSVNFHRIHFH